MTKISKMDLSTREAAKRLNVSVKTIQRWIKDGTFPNAYQASPRRTSPFYIPYQDIQDFDQLRRNITKN